MSPSESVILPDLALSVGTALYDSNLDLFNSTDIKVPSHYRRPPLKKGDEILFRARFVTLGDEFKMHHLHLLEL